MTATTKAVTLTSAICHNIYTYTFAADHPLPSRQTIRTILVRPIRLLSRPGRREAEAVARDLLRTVTLDESYDAAAPRCNLLRIN